MSDSPSKPCAAIVGGGLAGLAAAVGLARRGLQVDLFEARSSLGGRAGSFRDPASGELIDHCQHVGMGCCTNLADFCRRTGAAHLFREDDRLVFIGPGGRRYSVRPTRWLPAPLHFAPALLQLGYLSLGDRLSIARAMWQLLRTSPGGQARSSFEDWLVAARQSPAAQRQFWAVILTSALSETLDRVSLPAGRKVFLDGFMASPAAARLMLPEAPLAQIYGEQVTGHLAEQGVGLHLRAAVKQITRRGGGRWALHLADREPHVADFVVAAVPWRRIGELFAPELQSELPQLAAAARLESSPITAVHLCYDRKAIDVDHAVLIDRLSQWVFDRGPRSDAAMTGHRYQVVVSASRGVRGRPQDEVIAEVCRELAEIWPEVAQARLLEARLVTDPHAVFSVTPSAEAVRAGQKTALAGLLLAGDWTATGWPATMEGAVRSGYLAAEEVLTALGRAERLIVPDLRPGLLVRLLARR